MVIVGPGYLNQKCLPYASDVFYHDRLIYFLPTGFHPLELHSVLEFPRYCYDNSIALPGIIWEMCNLYFENGKAATESINLIEPLRKKFVTIAGAIYSRDRSAIDKSRKLLAEHPLLYEGFQKTAFDLRFAARELLSHVLFEIFIQEGYKGAVEYFRANTNNPDDLLHLIAAVLINRLKLFVSHSTSLLIYEHTWYPLINQMVALYNPDKSTDVDVDKSDSHVVEHFRYKLFETILMPIFGRCDTQSKSHMVAELASKKRKEIDALKDECQLVARKVVLLPTHDVKLRQAELSDMIRKHVTEPLGDLLEKPSKDTQGLLRDFILDSTVIGGVLSILQHDHVNVLITTAAAAGISAGVKYILRKKSRRKIEPSDLLVTGIQKMRIEHEEIQRQLNRISIEEVSLPSEWQSFA